jgi:hypothetical protein
VNVSRRSLAACAVAASLAIAACGKTEAPPAPKVAAPPPPAAPAVDAETKRLAGEVYVYAYPLVLMDATRAVQTAKGHVDTFAHRRVADATSTDAYPNADFLYSQAWLDLSQGPVVVSVPDTKGRYYLIAMLDAWTNVAASLGKRTTGTEKVDFAIVGPRWKGTLPGGVSEVRSPTEMAWLLARTRVEGRNDEAAAARVADQFRVVPLSQFGRKGAKAPPPAAAAPAAADAKTTPRDQVDAMDAPTFFSRFAALLASNPPVKDDAPMVDKIRKLGIVAGQPFDMAKLAPLQATSIAEGAKAAHDAIAMAGKGIGSADVRNGWSVDRELGRWGVDYGKRAVSAWRGLGVNAPEDAIFLSARFDGGGRKLDGGNRYVLHFDRANLPPADGFWSIGVYDDAHHFVANRLNRHQLQSDDFKSNADGSLDIHIQSADPGREREANWLPTPKGGFNVMLRLYWPKQEALDGRWVPPGIAPAK